MKKLKLFSLLMLLFVGVTSMWATDYQLVTSTDDLEADAHYVIGSAATGSGVFMSTETSANNRRQTAAITITDGKITATSDVLDLKLGGSTGAWTFLTTNYTSTNGYLSNADSGTGNNCKVGNTDRPFTITFDGSKAIITATAGNPRNILRYNSGSTCFACYASGQKEVYLYKEVASKPTLSSIAVKTAPTKVVYTEGDFFEPTGLVITRTYSDDSSSDWAYEDHESEFSFSPSTSTALATTDVKVTITYGGKSVDQAITVNAAAACVNPVAVTKGNEENGSFVLSATEVCGDGDGGVIFITDITPDEGYELDDITATAGTVDKENNKVTDIIEATTITVTFKALPKYTVSFNVGGGSASQDPITEASHGAGITLPAGPTPTCSADGWVFAGWAEAAVGTQTTDAPAKLYQKDENYKPASDCTLYAVYKKTEEGGGSGSTTVTITPSEFTGDGDPYTLVHDQSAYTITVNKNGGTKPTVNTTYGDARVYANGTLVISNASSMTKLVFNISTQGKKRLAPITASVGTIATQTSGDETVTWTGNATEVTFTVGATADYGSDGSSKAGQLDFNNITATSEGAASTTYYLSTPTCCVKHAVTIDTDIENGTVTASPASACEGETITLTFAPESGYYLSAWTLNSVAQDVEENTFAMPAADVTVSATFTHYACTDLAEPELAGVTLTCNSAVFTWNAVEHAEKYTLAIEGTDIDVEITEGLTYTATGLTAGTNYNFVLTAVGDAINYCDKALASNFKTPDQPAAPTFSVEAGTYYEAQSVSISAAGAQAIYYTLNGDDPTEESAIYTGAIAINESKTIKAVAKYEVGLSAIGEAAYTIIIPMTVAQAIELIGDNTTGIADQTVAGFISQIDSYNSKYSSITYWISDDGSTTNQMEVYSGKGLDGAAFSAVTDLTVGDKVIVNGKIKKYNTFYEFDVNSVIKKRVAIEDTPSSIAISGTPDLTMYAPEQTFDPKGLVVTATYNTGYQKVVTEDVEWSNDLEGGIVVADATVHVTATLGTLNASKDIEVKLAEQAPAFSPVAGTYTSAQNITLTAAEGAAIYYTLDGSIPSQATTLYEGPIALTTRGLHTIKAIAYSDERGESQVVIGEFTLNLPYTAAELVEAELPQEGTADITLLVDNDITGLTNNKYGVFLNQKDSTGKRDIEIFFRNNEVPDSWIIGGHLEGSVTGTWYYYAKGDVWEIEPNEGFAWDNLSYTKPAAGLAWSETTATAYSVGKPYELPTLDNPNGLNVDYSSSDPDIASIDDKGKITPKADGYTRITATYVEGNYQGQTVGYDLYVRVPQDVTLSGELTTKEYEYQEQINPAGLVVTVVYSDGTTEWNPETEDVEFIFDPKNTIAFGQETVSVQARWNGMLTDVLNGVVAKMRWHTVTVADGIENGTVVVKNGYDVVEAPYNKFAKGHGETLTVEATPETGYRLVAITLNGETLEGNTFQIGSATEIVVSATFAPKAPAGLGWSDEIGSGYVAGKDPVLPTLINPNHLDVTYSSSNPNTATIDEKGVITIKTNGTTVITVNSEADDTYVAGEASYTLTVYTVKSVEISGDLVKSSYDYGEILSYEGLIATATYMDGSEADVTSVATWTCEDQQEYAVTSFGTHYVFAQLVLSGYKQVDLTQSTYVVNYTRFNTNGELLLRSKGEIVANNDGCVKDQQIEIQVTPNDGYQLDEIRVINTATEEDVTASVLNDMTITMPTFGITVNATFKVLEPVKFQICGSMTDNWASRIDVRADSYTFENLAAGTYQLKVIDGDDWKGFADMTAHADNMFVGNDGNIGFVLAQEGDVVVNYVHDGAFTVQGTFVLPVIQIIGNFNGPWDDNTEPITLDVVADGKASKTLNLTGGWYDFKVIRAGEWLGKDNAGDDNYLINRDNNSVGELDYGGEVKAISIQPDKAGDYTFSYSFATGVLTVDFPAWSYQVVGTPGVIPAGWDPTAGVDMTLNDGVYSYKLEDVTLHAGTNYEYKIAREHSWNGSFPDDNASFSVEKNGIYEVTFTVNASTLAYAATPKLIQEIDIDPTAQIGAYFTEEWTTNDMVLATDKKSASFTKSLTSGTYEFKVVLNGSDWRSNGYTYHRDYTGTAGITGNTEANMILSVVTPGEYTFTWTFETNALEITFPDLILENGYYVVGLKSWVVADLTDDDKLSVNPNNNDEFIVNKKLVVGDEFQIVYVYNDAIVSESWRGIDDEYGAWGVNNYKVDANHAGNNKTIYFNKTHQDEWAGFIYVPSNDDPTGINNTDASVKAVKTMENGVLIIRRGDKTYNGQGQLVK